MSVGDLGPMLREGSIPDHDWLEVDEDVYRHGAPVPQQNLDFREDLARLWGTDPEILLTTDGVDQGRFKDAAAGTLVTSGRSAEETPASAVVAAARRLMSAGIQGRAVVAQLSARFSKEAVASARPELSELASREAYLLGGVYLSAADFPRCASGELRSVRASLEGITCLVRKAACAGCVHGSTGGCARCGGLPLVASVPWSEALAKHHGSRLAASRQAAIVPPERDTEEGWRLAFQRAYASRPSAPAPVSSERPRHIAELPPLRMKDPRDVLIEDSCVRSEEVLSSVKVARELLDDIERTAAARGVAPTSVSGWKGVSKVLLGLSREVAGSGEVATPDWSASFQGQREASATVEASLDDIQAQPVVRVAPRPEILSHSRPSLRQAVREALVTGLLGKALEQSLRQRVGHLLGNPGAREEVQAAMKEAGSLGHAYIDPTIYPDYGVCRVGGKAHRGSTVPYVVEGPRCASCVKHREGSCSAYGKRVVAAVPPARLEAIRAAALSSSVPRRERVASVVDEFQLGRERPLRIDAERAPQSGPDVVLGKEWKI